MCWADPFAKLMMLGLMVCIHAVFGRRTVLEASRRLVAHYCQTLVHLGAVRAEPAFPAAVMVERYLVAVEQSVAHLVGLVGSC